MILVHCVYPDQAAHMRWFDLGQHCLSTEQLVLTHSYLEKQVNES